MPNHRLVVVVVVVVVVVYRTIIIDYQDLVKDIERLKWKLMEKDKDADKATMSGRKASSTLQKSRSLEESGGAAAAADQRTYFEHQFDLRMQLETVQQDAAVLQDKLAEVTRLNDQLTTENKKLQILAGRSSTSSKSSSQAGKLDDNAVSDLTTATHSHHRFFSSYCTQFRLEEGSTHKSAKTYTSNDFVCLVTLILCAQK